MTVMGQQGGGEHGNDRLRALRRPDRPQSCAPEGPLADLAISFKDVIDVAGWTISCNHRPYSGRRPEHDAAIVGALRRAGAGFAGTSATLEFAYGGFSDRALYPPARNPWNLQRSPGGSSAGAGAAAAAGLCDASVATDTSGSVRGPAAYCGVLGLKLGHGRVSMEGIHPLAPSLDCVGILARDLDPLARIGSTLCRRDLLMPDAPPRRIGWIAQFDASAGVTPQVAMACERALAQFAAQGVEIRPVRPLHDLKAYHAACIIILLHEAWRIHGPRLRSEREGYCPTTWARLAVGAAISERDYAAALALRERLRADLDLILSEVDLIATAAAPSAAPRVGATPLFSMLEQQFLTAPASVTGHPALSLPIGFDDDDMPLALQLVSARDREDCLVQAVQLYRGATDWHRRWPPHGRNRASSEWTEKG
jgi:aspartyl-tRNA(Asn)/glutamyl-tRNA(Gln) amidotransferase subunit A